MSEITATQNFVLLSKIAKEKKYAQEYLGLLARRGDIGSIRIGKRWYTKTEWFEEFLFDAEKRKEAVKLQTAPEVAVELKLEQIETKDEAQEKVVLAEPIKIINKQVLEQKEEKIFPTVPEQQPAVRVAIRNKQAASKAPALETARNKVLQSRGFDLRRTVVAPDKAKQIIISQKPAPKTTPVQTARPAIAQAIKLQQKNYYDAVRKQENIQLKPNKHNFSPSFVGKESMFSLLFPRLAFSAALMLLLAVLSGGVYLYKKDTTHFPLIGTGVVAGAEDVRLASVSSFASETSTYLESEKGLTKQNISLSRVLLRAALEKNP